MVQTPFHVYLVGGAVRDQLLNLPVKDRDWVIVGATPQTLIDLGYQQVGKDFPVFLHPQIKEEYALALSANPVKVTPDLFVTFPQRLPSNKI